jgi:hypothetical protein
MFVMVKSNFFGQLEQRYLSPGENTRADGGMQLDLLVFFRSEGRCLFQNGVRYPDLPYIVQSGGLADQFDLRFG